jgi:hypothetical protein
MFVGAMAALAAGPRATFVARKARKPLNEALAKGQIVVDDSKVQRVAAGMASQSVMV